MPGRRIGLHVSAAGGVALAPGVAHEYGAECFQFFSRSPRGGAAPPITDEAARAFRATCRRLGYESYIHTPYYVNFASKNNRIYRGTIRVVHEELERASRLGVRYVMTHMGSAKDHVKPSDPPDTMPASALKQAIRGLKEVFKGAPKFTTSLLLEISAGAGAVMGDSLEELRFLLKGLGRKDVFVCLDTCHLFASGYDLRTAASLAATMKQFRRVLGVSMLKLVHANDSKVNLGEHKDRHEHIGRGKIGTAGFKALLAHPDLRHTNFILETPRDDLIRKDIQLLKRYRDES